MRTKTLLQVAGTVFAIVVILHGLRIINGWALRIGAVDIPMWVSWIAVILIGWLAYNCWVLQKKAR